MSSTGIEKWMKYFSESDVDTTTYSKELSIDVYSVFGNRKIDKIKSGKKVTVLRKDYYDPKYTVKYESKNSLIIGRVREKFIRKPLRKKGATEYLGIQSSLLVKYGKLTKINYFDNVIECRSFSNKKSLENSILKFLKENPLVREHLIISTKTLFDSGYEKIIWSEKCPLFIRREFGKYLGEVLIGLKFFKEKKCKKFYVPTKNINTLDSFILDRDNNLIKISSKFGNHNSSSIFSHIVNCKNLKKQSVIKDLIQLKKYYDIIGIRDCKKLVYAYGFEHILNIKNKSFIRQNLNFSVDVRNGEVDSQRELYIKKLLKTVCKNKEVLNKFPDTLTYYFSRVILERINNCKVSLDYLKHEIKKTSYIQYTLNNKDWNNLGIVNFNILDTFKDEFDLRLHYKSIKDDVMARNGMLTYEIKKRIKRRS